jgi:uncharacterized damage-inducible protein DinB
MTSSAEMLSLRYPIGERVRRATHTSASRAAAIDDIAALPGNLRRAVAGLTVAQLDAPYRPGGWTVRQVVHHVADAHMVICVRTKVALTEHSPPVRLWDEVTWAELPDTTTMPIEPSLAIVDAVHARFVYLLKALAPHQFNRSIEHPVWGTVPVDELVELCAWHGKHHAAQITALRTRTGW